MIFSKCSCGKRIPQGSKCDCKKERYKDYDKNVRSIGENKKYNSFYHSKEWIKLSNYIKIKYKGLCLMCLINYKQIVAYDVVHHIDTIKEHWDKRLSEDNLIPLCHHCHNGIHRSYNEKQKNELKQVIKDYKEKFIY